MDKSAAQNVTGQDGGHRAPFRGALKVRRTPGRIGLETETLFLHWQADAALADQTKATEAARQQHTDARLTYGVTGAAISELKDNVARHELKLRQLADARDDAQARLEAATRQKNLLAKRDFSRSSSVKLSRSP